MRERATEKPNVRLTMTIPEFAAATGCSRNLAYSLARQDKLPVPVIKLGAKRLVVSRRAVERLLEGEVWPLTNADKKNTSAGEPGLSQSGGATDVFQ